MALCPASRPADSVFKPVLPPTNRWGSKRRRSSDSNPSVTSECRSKRARRSDLNPSPSTNHENVKQEMTMHNVRRLKKGADVPEEILDIIVSRAPLAAQCRFRTVQKKWKELLYQPPPCMVSKNLKDLAYKYYCDSEKKWYSLPSKNRPPSFGINTTWHVADVDAGLVCYHCELRGWYWLWVCNPLKPSSSRLIMPDYPRRDPKKFQPEPPLVKLVVNRETKNFKLVVMRDKVPNPVVYDSTTCSWCVCNDHPNFPQRDFFVWKNVVYAYNARRGKGPQGHEVAALNEETMKWVQVHVNFPCYYFPASHMFLSDNEQMFLVLFSYRKKRRPYLSVWKLECEGLNSRSEPDGDLKWNEWQKIDVETDTVLLHGHRVTSGCLGPGYICFTLSDNKFQEFGSETQRCVKYSFAARTWTVVRLPEANEGWQKTYSLHSWEPSLDIDPSSQ